MANLTGIFIIAEITGSLASKIAEVQRVHDPRLAALWPPHITLIGSSGAGPILSDTPLDDLRARISLATAAIRPIHLSFGPPHRFADRDIVVLPLDPHGPLRALHEAMRMSGVRTHQARYPFTPHCTLTMYPPLEREREKRLLSLRFSQPFVVDSLRVLLTREPQPAKLLFELPLRAATEPS